MITPEVLKESEIRSSTDRHPSRIVLRRVHEKTYATHMEVLPPQGESYFILGRYFFNLADAEADFRQRIRELNSLQTG